MKVDNDVLSVLSGAQTDGNALRLVGQLDRRLYERTNAVLEAAGGKWNRKAKAHVFDGDAADAIEQVLLSGEITRPQDFGYFPTPPAIVVRLLELAKLEIGMLVLEPSAGQGHIARAVAEVASVDCIELLKTNADVIRAAGFARYVRVGDFLAEPQEPVYDRVIMNPPFAKQADIRHVMHALGFLRPGGRLVSVMSSGVLFRSNLLTTDFRNTIDAYRGTIEECPDGSFMESGTMVRTVIVSLRRPT